ncbi:unnamed protein product, partial [marine sediment metagenome]
MAVTEADDKRSYQEIAEEISRLELCSELQQFNTDTEETYEEACLKTRNMMCPTWLGLSRDMRLFEVAYNEVLGYWGEVVPRYHGFCQHTPETNNEQYKLAFVIGPGSSCKVDISRRLEEGVLPILHST